MGASPLSSPSVAARATPHFATPAAHSGSGLRLEELAMSRAAAPRTPMSASRHSATAAMMATPHSAALSAAEAAGDAAAAKEIRRLRQEVFHPRLC